MKIPTRLENLESLTVGELLARPSGSLLNRKNALSLIQPGRSGDKIESEIRQSKYFWISQLMQSGQINSRTDEIHYQRHLSRMVALLSGAHGRGLDVGCGDPEIGAALVPKNCEYVGIDPFAEATESLRFVGLAEDLPFVESSFDFVLFNTSLDHVLDYVTALKEAARVMRKGSKLFISTLVWLDNYSLIPDEVHFHHFRYFELTGALEFSGFEVEEIFEYPYKDDDHRVGAYIKAAKVL